MKIIKIAIIEVGTLLFLLSVHGQGTFENLNFESGNVGSITLGLVPVSSALPYWTVSIGGVQQTDIPYNGLSTGATQVSLVGPGLAIDGNYSVLLTGGVTASAASISQTGLIPAGTESLLFEAQQGTGGGGGGNLELLIGTQSVPIVSVGTGPNYTMYSANVSQWAGDAEQITFSALEGTLGLNNWTIDDISFSATAVPEPSPVILTGIAGLLFGFYRRVACKR